MKRTIFLIASILACFVSGAQNMYDAANFCQNTYYGTARSMGVGNAMTAIGGELGSVEINPAGSAVANYGQIALTPGLTISSVSASYSPVGDTQSGSPYRTGRTKFSMPNLGAMLTFDTHNNSGIKSFSFSFTSNTTNSFLNCSEAFGGNGYTSRLAENAASATYFGYGEDVLSKYGSFTSTDIPWDILTSYQGGLFSSYGSIPGSCGYVGNSEALSEGESYHYVPAELNQNLIRNTFGTKRDLVLNFAVNVNDFLFIGANLGLPVATYSFSELYSETPVNPEKFPITFLDKTGTATADTYYTGATSDYYYSARLSGVYGKFGVIVLPLKNLRIGAAIQTPTSFNVSESWSYAASSSYANSIFNDSEVSPEGTFSYRLISPLLANFGIAYTFAQKGFVSLDYEIADYSSMKFMAAGGGRNYTPELNEINRGIKEAMQPSHFVRFGAEFKPVPMIALRGGVNLITTPERGYSDKTWAYSLGIGYSSPGSFFVDLAARLTEYPASAYGAYYDYDNYDQSGNLVNKASPIIVCNRKLLDVALTLGWRF